MTINRTRAATAGLLAPASLALGMSADTSYRFLGAALAITDHTERALLCGVAEAAIVALTIYAWATRTKGPAYLAYAAVLVQSIPAFRVSGATGGPIRVILGPVLLAVMLHLLLGLELRMSGGQSDGIIGAALRELRERVTAFLGIGRRGADSAAIARSRAADRAVDLADLVAAATEGTRKHSRRAAKLAAAIDAARHGLDPAEADAAEAAIVARVVRRKSVTGLATIGVRHDWTAALTPRTAEVPAPAAEVPEPAELPAAEVPAVVPAEVPEVPPVQVPAPAAEVPQVPAEVPALTLVTADIPPAPVRSADVSALVKAGSADVPADPQTPARGSATRAVRQLIKAGTTDPGTIRADLEGRGLKAPSDRYIRRLVSEARNNNRTGAYL
ncbi:hypothetical protein ACFY2Z_41010 [Streptomyces sp. NPDC001222]|uniref:hypothetical protein n=1 Tax=Streptomyces sp. NPDC001222 TaxID=3364548 RepID=UPI0036933C14